MYEIIAVSHLYNLSLLDSFLFCIIGTFLFRIIRKERKCIILFFHIFLSQRIIELFTTEIDFIKIYLFYNFIHIQNAYKIKIVKIKIIEKINGREIYK